MSGLLAATGFAVDHHVFDVRGLCSSCRTTRR
jgi:Fe2+ or Zn2+ uptake regulation protein